MSLFKGKGDDGVYLLKAGADIDPAIEEGIFLAGEFGHEISFKHNNVIVKVKGDSDPVLIKKDWKRGIDASMV